MNLDKATFGKLQKYVAVFRDARDRNANESDTVMYLIEFFKEVLEYDPLRGEISKEVAIKDRYCDFAIKLGEEIVFLVEAKSAGIKSLSMKHIEQASNYASHSGLEWILLTSGVEWRLYHLTFATGIEAEIVFQVSLLEDFDKNSEHIWDLLGLLRKDMVKEDSLSRYWEQKKVLSPKTVIKVLLGLPVLLRVRQELNRESPARLEIKDVFVAVREILSKEALLEVGDITPPVKRRKRRRKRQQVDAATGQTVEVEEEVEEEVEGVAEDAEPSKTEPQPRDPNKPGLGTTDSKGTG